MARSKITTPARTQQLATGEMASAKSVYDIIGKKMFPYKQTTKDEYLKSLEAMNLSDLQRHAIEVANIVPSHEKRERLVNKLLETFLKRQTQFLNVAVPDTMTEEGKAAALEILKRGRN